MTKQDVLANAFINSNIKLGSCVEYKGNGMAVSPNLSDIYTPLVQNVGRYVDFYASDLLHQTDAVEQAVCEGECGAEFDRYILFGLREYGVDNNAQIEDNVSAGMLATLRWYYRKLLAVRVLSDANKVSVELRDITGFMNWAHYFAAIQESRVEQ